MAGLVAEEDGGGHVTPVEVHLEHLVAWRRFLSLRERRGKEEGRREEGEAGGVGRDRVRGRGGAW